MSTPLCCPACTDYNSCPEGESNQAFTHPVVLMETGPATASSCARQTNNVRATCRQSVVARSIGDFSTYYYYCTNIYCTTIGGSATPYYDPGGIIDGASPLMYPYGGQVKHCFCN